MMNVISRRTLNRALLERQMLLRRWQLPVATAIERLVGIQAQAPTPPYFGLWTRLSGFKPEMLSELITARDVVRIALMRSTIHLVTARDCLALRPVLQPMLERALYRSQYGPALAGADIAAILAHGRALVEERPRTTAQLRTLLHEQWPERDATSMAYAIRNLAPLVQVPPRGLWGGSGQATCTTAEYWLGRPLDVNHLPDEMVVRYLAAFGPASVKDMQVWSGLTGLWEAAERLRPRLLTFRDDGGSELFDVPDAPRPEPDTPAPARFLPEYDNILLSHAGRTRIINDEHRKLLFTMNGVMPSTFLLDGFVAGTWKISRSEEVATLRIQPFATLQPPDRLALAEEGSQLLNFAATGAQARHIEFSTAP